MPYPYTSTVSGLVALLRQLRSAFPATVTAETLKKWSIASNNEGVVLSVVRFLGIIDEEGRKHPDAARVFSEHDDAAFAEKFGVLVSKAYADLFELHGDKAWTLERNRLISFFRTADGSSARVGNEQAKTFLALAGLAGHEEALPSAGVSNGAGRRPSPVSPPRPRVTKSRTKVAATETTQENSRDGGGPTVTVRLELNLPVTDDQSVYDKIFQSIRANLY